MFPLVAARLTCSGIGILACQPTTDKKRGNTGVYDYDDGSAGTRDIFTRKRLRGGSGWGGWRGAAASPAWLALWFLKSAVRRHGRNDPVPARHRPPQLLRAARARAVGQARHKLHAPQFVASRAGAGSTLARRARTGRVDWFPESSRRAVVDRRRSGPFRPDAAARWRARRLPRPRSSDLASDVEPANRR